MPTTNQLVKYGRVKQRLSATAGDVREPAWGPFIE